MSDSQELPWSDGPNAPSIPYFFYLQEKSFFAGILISSILYGMPNIPSPTRPSVREHSIRLVCFRDRDRTVVSKYDRAV